MAKCHCCDKVIPKKNPVLECSRCQKVVHATAACTGLSSKQLSALKAAENLEWTCNGCNHNSSRSKSFVTLADFEEEVDEEIIPSVGGADVRKLLDQLRKEVGNIVVREMRTVTSSVQFCSEKVDELSESVEALTGRIKDMEKRQTHLENRNKFLELKTEALEQKYHEMEQLLLADYVEISGIPETNSIDLPKAVENVMLKLNAFKDDIIATKRLPPRKTGPGAVLVKLRSEVTRQSLLSAVRDNIILARDVIPDLTMPAATEKIYVREAITPFFKNLLWQAKQDLKNTYKFIWFREGRVLVRKNEKAKVLKIRAKSDIQSLMSNKITQA